MYLVDENIFDKDCKSIEFFSLNDKEKEIHIITGWSMRMMIDLRCYVYELCLEYKCDWYNLQDIIIAVLLNFRNYPFVSDYTHFKSYIKNYIELQVGNEKTQ